MIKREILQKRFFELDSFPKKPTREDAQKRGIIFEELIQDLLEHEKLLSRRSYHTADGRSEQIDGALNIDGVRALLEVKWVKSGLAASELYAFSGKVEGKFIGTIGLFISREKLSSNFLNSLRTGRRQCVIVIHDDDVDHIFKPSFPIEEYLISLIDALSFDNIYHLPASEFIRKYTRKSTKGIKKQRHPLIKKALSNKDYTNVIAEWFEELSSNEINELLYECLEIFLKKAERGKIGTISKDNLICMFKEIIPNLKKEKIKTDWYFFDELSMNFRSSVFSELIEYFAPRLKFLNSIEINKIGRRLKKQWEQGIGDYHFENDMAEVTEPMWDYLNCETKEYLLTVFLNFISSDRRPHFPQMRVANKILKEYDAIDTEPIVRKLLKEGIKSWFIEGIDELDDNEKKKWIKRMVNWYSRQYDEWRPYINKELEKVVKSIIKQIEKESA